MFSTLFWSFLMFLDTFGPIRMHPDAFWMRLDAFGNESMFSVILDFFDIFSDFFGCFRMALTVYEVFRTLWWILIGFLDVSDKNSYLQCIVIYRESPLHGVLWKPKFNGSANFVSPYRCLWSMTKATGCDSQPSGSCPPPAVTARCVIFFGMCEYARISLMFMGKCVYTFQKKKKAFFTNVLVYPPAVTAIGRRLRPSGPG